MKKTLIYFAIGILLLRYFVIGFPIIDQNWGSWFFWIGFGWVILLVPLDWVLKKIGLPKRQRVKTNSNLGTLTLMVVTLSLTLYCIFCFAVISLPGNTRCVAGTFVKKTGTKLGNNRIWIQFEGDSYSTSIPLRSPSDPMFLKLVLAPGSLYEGTKVYSKLKSTQLGTIVLDLSESDICSKEK